MRSLRTTLLQEEEQAQAMANTQQAEAAVVTAEMVDVSLIFGFKEFLPQFLAGLGHVIMFPFAAGASLIRAILMMREAYLEKEENRTGAVVRAIVETLSALAITAAVIGTFVATASFEVLGPIIFTAALGFKTLFHLGAAFYYGMKALLSSDPQEYQVSVAKMKTNLVLTALTALTAVAAGLVFVANKTTFGLLGVIGGALGAAYAIYKGCTTKPAQPVVKTPALTSDAQARSSSVPSSRPTLTVAPRATVANTTDIMQGTAISLQEARLAQQRQARQQAEQKEQEARRIAQAEEEALERVRTDLNQKMHTIVTGLRRLERSFGANRAFDMRSTQSGSFADIPTYWWDRFYSEKYESAPSDLKPLIQSTDATIKEYNELLRRNKELLSKESRRISLFDAENARKSREQQEREDEEFRKKTGWTRESAKDFAGLLNPSAYSYQ